MLLTLFGNGVSSLDRETHPIKKTESAKALKSDALSLIKLRETFDTYYNVEITITLRPKARKLDPIEANKHLINILNNEINDYSGKNKFYYYFNFELHKPYDNTAFIHSHGVISFYSCQSYADYLRRIAALDKWLYRKQLKANWATIISLHVKYPIKEGNINRKVGSFKSWYEYIHDNQKTGNLNSILGFSYNIIKCKKRQVLKLYNTLVSQDSLNRFFTDTKK